MTVNSIPWAKPVIGDEEINQILDSFKADWLTMGPKVKAFEAEMAKIMGVPHAIAVNNGSMAIELVLQILGIKPGDEIIVPSMTYYATAASVSRIGAVPVFVDVKPNTLTLDPEKISAAVSEKTKAVIFVDYGGVPADINAIKAEAKKHNLLVVQDGAQSLGGSYQGKPLGTQTDLSTTSFHMAKIMTTVEGGMIFTHSDEYAKEARIFRNQGESAKYMHARLGTNARMNDVTAAIGLEQTKRLAGFLSARKRIAARYNQHFAADSAIQTLNHDTAEGTHANFLYSILISNRDAVANALKDQNIDTRICYPMALYAQEVYASGRAPSRVMPSPVAESVATRVLNLPLFPTMTDAEVDRVAEVVLKAVKAKAAA